MSEEEQNVVKFKKVKRKNVRRTKIDEESDEENEILSKIEEMKTVQKMRERPNGVSVVTLALGEKISKTESDPFKIKTGGLVNMASLKKGKVDDEDDDYSTEIGTQFSAETNKRDEDDEMMKYIEVELSKRKGKKESEGEEKKYCSPEEAALLAIPDHLRESSSQRSEEMLSNQMLSGIPEVDLGIEAKIKNIEATEEAKLKLLWESQNKKDGPSQFVPTNMAVNFVQHNRFTLDDSQKSQKNSHQDKNDVPLSIMQKGTKRNKGAEKATDDYHFEKLKKQYRKYV